MRALALDSVVRERVLLVAADKLHLVTSDERLERLFKSDPEFALAAQPRRQRQPRRAERRSACRRKPSPSACARTCRAARCMQALGNSAIAPATAASAALDAMYQQREVQVQRFDAKDQMAKVTPSEAEIEAFYKDPSHAAQFQAPEEASIEYVVARPRFGDEAASPSPKRTCASTTPRTRSATPRPRSGAPATSSSRPTRTRPRPSATRRSAKAESAARRGAQEPARVRRDRAQEFRRRRLGEPRAATSTSSAAARWSSRSRTPPSR